MATLYCDFANGNDNYAGSSFALLDQGTNGRITSTTFSSVGASFPNNGTLIGQYLSIFNGTIYAVYNITAWVSSTSLTIAALSGGTALANQTVDRQYYIGGRWKNLTTGATAVRTIPGDTVRIMGSPEPTSLGQNGVWTSQALQATKSIISSTNATPIAITSTIHSYSTGDTVVITGHTINTNANGTWEITVTGANTFTLDGSAGNGVGGASGTVRLRNNTRVMLTTPITQNIASTGPGRAAWVASANCLIVPSSSGKEHSSSDQIQVNTAFTTGKSAYYTLPSTLDLSAYQQVSFWVQSGAALSSGQIDLRLCSDTTGDTVVNTVSVPSVPGIGRWQACTVDLQNNLGNAIQSIAFYVNIDLSTTGNISVSFSNIIACKASSAPDSLTLTSLIGKNTTGETFWGIQSINGRRVMLDADTNATPTSITVRGYYGTSETVTTWKRETIKLGPAVSPTTALQTIQEGGTDGSPITYSGGWDRTNMSTQSLETWLDGVNGNGYALTVAQNFINIDTIAAVRFSSVIRGNASNRTMQLVAINNNTTQVIDLSSSANFLNTLKINYACANAGVVVSAGISMATALELGKIVSNGGSIVLDIGLAYPIRTIKSIGTNSTISNNVSSPFFGPIAYAENLSFSDNTISYNTSTFARNIFFKDCLTDDLTEFLFQAPTLSELFSHNHDRTAGNHKIFMFGALISTATDQRKTASGFSWKIQPSSSVRSSIYPVTLSLAKVAVSANNLVTIKAWMRRDNTGLTMRLVCKGGQISGVTNDVVSSLSTTNLWEELTITFTPTEVGVVEITAEAWGGTTFSGWVDDLTISQA